MAKPTKEVRDDHHMMSHPSTWFNFVLPIRNRRTRKPGHLPDCAVLIDHADYRTTVFLVNMFALNEYKSYDAMPQKKYTSVDAILADGWEVD